MTSAPRPGPAAPPDDAASAAQERVRAAREALAASDLDRAVALASGLHAADAADLVAQLDADKRAGLIAGLGGGFAAELLTYLDEDDRAELLPHLRSDVLAGAVASLETDDAVELLAGLDDRARISVLDSLPGPERFQIERGLAYPEDSAGRLMQRSFVAVPEFWNVGQAIDFLRESDNLPDEFYEIFVVDPAGHPVGTVPLNRFLRTKRPVNVGAAMDREPTLVPVDMDQEAAAFLFRQYDLASAAVVDEAGRMVGVIMIDDIVDVIHKEAGEDILRLAGVVGETGLARSVVSTTRDRFTWLLVNLLTAVLASAVIYAFEGTIEQIVAVAVLMPIVASMGGNAGTQTLTVAVRALATYHLTAANAGRIIVKELLVGSANGLLFAALVAAVGVVWYGSPELGLVFGAAMLITMAAAGLAGILIPLGLQRIRVDPAVASSVFVTTVTDVVGFFSFLGLVAWLLL